MDNRDSSPVQLDYQRYTTQSNQRVTLLVVATLAVVLLLSARLFYLQILQTDEFSQKAAENGVRVIPLTAPRGIIYDRHSKILATNKLSYALRLDPRRTTPIELNNTVQLLAPYVGKSPQELFKTISLAPDSQPVYLRHQLDNQVLAQLNENLPKLPGVQIVTVMERFYPESDLAAHMMGYMGQITAEELKTPTYKKYPFDTQIGKAGLEKSYESWLRGKDGKDLMTINLQDGSKQMGKRQPPIAGHSLKLAIDKDLQLLSQQLLRVKKYNGAIVVMDVNTGGLHAMVSEPTYNPNIFNQGLSQDEWQQLQNAANHPFIDRSVTPYAPGSIFKIVTAAAASEKAYLNAGRTFVSRGYFNVGGHIFYDWHRGGFGAVNIYQALAHSIDTVFYEVSLEMGIERIKAYGDLFRINEKTGVELPHEASGQVPDAAWKQRVWKQPWQPGDTVNSSIGQGYVQMTPLQAVQMIAAVANGGKILKPHLVESILDERGQIIRHIEGEVMAQLNFSHDTWDILHKGLRGAVSYGTAKAMEVNGFPAAGKTGTAETHIPRRTHAWVVGYAPVNQPRYAVCVFLEHGGSGGGKAAPLAQEIFSYLSGQRKKH